MKKKNYEIYLYYNGHLSKYAVLSKTYVGLAS